MEPDEIIPENKPEPSAPVIDDQPDATGLHNEGVDIVGSSEALDNEFFKPEEVAYSGTTNDAAVEPPIEKDIDVDIKDTLAIPVMPAATPTPVTPPPPKPVASPAPVAAPIMPTSPLAEEKAPVQNDPSIKRLRTFKSDAEEAVKYGGVSRVDIAVAAQKKREASNTPIQYKEESHASPGLYITIVALIVVLLGGGWYYWFNSSTAMQSKIVAPKVTIIGIVPFAKAAIVGIDLSSDPMALIAAKLSATVPSLGTVAALAPVSSATATVMMPISDVLSGTHIPNRLARSLASDYMIGSYEYDVQSPFIILKNTFFQNAFAGMLEWESQIGTDLAPLIQISDSTVTTADAGTATFSDGVISNVNVRILKDSSGRTLLTYAFADKDTIVITTNATALKYLLNQILQVRTIQ